MAQTAPDVAFANGTGEGAKSPFGLGYFYIKTNDDTAQTINAGESNGANFSYFTGNDADGTGTVVTTAAGVTNGSFSMPAVGVPEPTALAFLSIGGLGLIRRRRTA
jgi:hypothetical protein